MVRVKMTKYDQRDSIFVFDPNVIHALSPLRFSLSGAADDG